MSSQDYKIKNFIISLILVFVLTATLLKFFVPEQVKAQGAPVGDTATEVSTGLTAGSTATSAGANTAEAAFSAKNFAIDVLKEIGRATARRVLADMTRSTINWINSGYWGTPLFLQSPDSFFKDIGKHEIKNLIDAIGYDSTRFPFGRQQALDIINAYKQQSSVNFEYSLSRVINDPALLNSYRNDFNVGGWSGFLVNTQYPQNNYIGSRILVYEDLARKLQGTVQNKAEKAQTLLDQGMGFLSPQVCITNPNYNNGRNEFQQPAFKSEIQYDPPKREGYETDDEWGQDMLRYEQDYQGRVAAERDTWTLYNSCPPKSDGSSGFVTTTPGSVVAATVNKALGGTHDMVLGGVNYGNSLSLIFDALINKFIDTGLSALASKVNPPPVEDDWSYQGQTLGSPAGGVNNNWAGGPDEVIILSEFKQTIEDNISNTTTELGLIDNNSSANPGILQILGRTWPKAQELDKCIPGPDMNWKERTDEEANKSSLKIQEKTVDDDPNEAYRARVAFNELKFAVDFFKDWIYNKMITELPNSIIYMDAVDEVTELSQQADQLINRRRNKTQTLARLQAIKIALDGFASQPEPGSSQERVLVSLKKQYNAINTNISNTYSIEDTQNDLNVAKENSVRLSNLITQCNTERQEKGWSRVTTSTPAGSSTFRNGDNEQKIFCTAPIVGGYDHESFRHSNDRRRSRFGGGNSYTRPGRVTHPEIPYVNAAYVFNYDTAFGSGDSHIELNCNLIYRSYTSNYKGSIPGLTNLLDSGTTSGAGTGEDLEPEEEDDNDTGPTPPRNPNYPPEPGVCASNEEIEQFLEDNPGDEERLPTAFPCD